MGWKGTQSGSYTYGKTLKKFHRKYTPIGVVSMKPIEIILKIMFWIGLIIVCFWIMIFNV